MRRAVLSVVAIAILTSGCQLPSTTGDWTTLTPAPVPTAREVPPGISVERTSVDPDTLVDGHFAALTNRSFTVYSEITARPIAGGPTSRVNRTGYVGADPTSFYVVSRYSGTVFSSLGSQQRFIWSNGSVTLVRQRSYGGVIMEASLPPRDRPPVDGQFENLLPTVLDSLQLSRIQRVNESTRVAYRIYATGEQSISGRAVALQFDNVSEIRLRMTVSADGLVRRFQIDYWGSYRDTRVRVHRTVRVSDIGSTRVPRPDWVASSGSDS
jgi:hypothetical protein